MKSNNKNWKEFLKWLVLNPNYNNGQKGIGEAIRAAQRANDRKIDVCTQYSFVVDNGNHIPFNEADYLANKGEKSY